MNQPNHKPDLFASEAFRQASPRVQLWLRALLRGGKRKAAKK